MRLELDLPAHYLQTEAGAASSATGAVRLTWSRLVPLPDRQDLYILRFMLAGLAPGETCRVGRPELVRARDGWQVALIDATLVDAGGRVVGARFGAFYVVLQHAANALAHCADAEHLAEARPALRELFLAARVSSADELTALADFWDDVTPSTGS